MLRRPEDVGRHAILDDRTVLHYVDALRHLANDAEIVSDEQHRHPHLAAELLQQLQNLRLDGDVESGRRLVCDEQVGLIGERHCDHYALPLAARELVRIRRQSLLRIADPDLVQ